MLGRLYQPLDQPPSDFDSLWNWALTISTRLITVSLIELLIRKYTIFIYKNICNCKSVKYILRYAAKFWEHDKRIHKQIIFNWKLFDIYNMNIAI